MLCSSYYKRLIAGILIIFFYSIVFTRATYALENYWPVQLGNWWAYEVTQFNKNEFTQWEQNYQGTRYSSSRNCSGIYGAYKDTTLGSKVAITVNPSMGYDRFLTSRFFQFYKEKSAAYHGPQYCNLGLNGDTDNSWNLQWFMRNPIYYHDQFWLGNEGGVRFYRSTSDGLAVGLDPSLLESKAEISSFGKFPKNSGSHYGGGRYPAVDSTWKDLPGYTYIPLTNFINIANTSHDVIPDMTYEFGGGVLSDKNDFRMAINTYLNSWRANKLVWDLEFIPLKAKSVLTKNIVPPETDIWSIIFFEPFTELNAALPQVGNEIACENWYFAKNIGLVKLAHSMVTVMPNDPDLNKTRQLCFYVYRQDFYNSTDAAKKNIDFQVLQPYLNDINKFKFSYPINAFELTNYKIYANSAADDLGFHSAAVDVIETTGDHQLEYFANGRYWLYSSAGDLISEGNLHDVWANKNLGAVTIGSQTVYPWTDNGPDEVESGSDVQALFQTNGIVINNGAYWLRQIGDAQPFKTQGLVKDIFPEYYLKFGDNTDSMSISGTGNNKILLTKNGEFFMYQKNVVGNIILDSSGKVSDLPGWQEAPLISGIKPFKPDAMAFGSVFNQQFNRGVTAVDHPIPSDKQLIVFQKGKVWVKYGFDGPWEDWGGHQNSHRCEPLGDINCDLQVKSDDLSALMRLYGREGEASADFDNSGTVNVLDFAALAHNFGAVYSPPTATPAPTSPASTNTPAPTATPTPTPTSIPTPTPTPILVTSVRGFDQTKGDAATNNRPKQTFISTDGKTLYTRFFDTASQSWLSWSAVCVANSGFGINSLSAYDQSFSVANVPRQTALSIDGATIYVRLWDSASSVWGSASGSSVATALLIPNVSALGWYDQTPGDAATGNRAKQTAVSPDGTILYSRFYNGSSWDAWSSSLVATALGSSGLTSIKSFNQSFRPTDNVPKQEVVASDAKTIYSRFYVNGVWDTNWTSSPISSLNIPQTVCP